jgi:hypothetical protein
MSDISKNVRKFLADNQSIADCAQRGLINYSALARLICNQTGTRKVDAVLMACRRIVKRRPKINSKDENILQIMRKASINLQTKMVVVIIEKPRTFEKIYQLQESVREEGGTFSIIEGEDVVTMIMSDNWVSEARSVFKGRILRVSEDLVRVHIRFSRKIETVPGVIAFVYRLLAEHNINVLEEMSCWTDLMVMVEEKDMQAVADALRVFR